MTLHSRKKYVSNHPFISRAPMENNQANNAPLEQLNMTYDAAEDRLLFRIGLAGNQEIIAWLTRRSSKILMQLLESIPVAGESEPVFDDPRLAQEMAKNEISQKLDFGKNYKRRQIVNKGAIFLVSDCRLHEINAQNVLEFVCTNKKSIRLNMNNNILMALINLLQVSVRNADWELHPESLLPAANSKPARLLH